MSNQLIQIISETWNSNNNNNDNDNDNVYYCYTNDTQYNIIWTLFMIEAPKNTHHRSKTFDIQI